MGFILKMEGMAEGDAVGCGVVLVAGGLVCSKVWAFEYSLKALNRKFMKLSIM